MSARGLAIVALYLFVAAWFLPVHELLEVAAGSDLGKVPELGVETGGTPGWRAFKQTWNLLTHEWKEWRSGVLGATCLTNFGMVIVMLALVLGRAPRGLGAVLIGCGILDAGWIYLLLDDSEFRNGLRPGYYLWTLSFFLAGFAFVHVARAARTAGA